MPHIIVKLWPGKSDQQKKALADAIVKSGMECLGHGEESFSVSFEEVPANQWKTAVYDADILHGKGKLYKKPGYSI